MFNLLLYGFCWKESFVKKSLFIIYYFSFLSFFFPVIYFIIVIFFSLPLKLNIFISEQFYYFISSDGIPWIWIRKHKEVQEFSFFLFLFGLCLCKPFFMLVFFPFHSRKSYSSYYYCLSACLPVYIQLKQYKYHTIPYHIISLFSPHFLHTSQLNFSYLFISLFMAFPFFSSLLFLFSLLGFFLS